MRNVEKIRIYFLKFLSNLMLNNKKNLSSAQQNKFLIITHLGIGDTIFFFPVIRTLILNYPKIQISILTHSKIIGSMLEKNFPNIEVIHFNFLQESQLNKLFFWGRIRKQKFQVLLTNVLGLKKDYIQLGIFCQIPIRIGHVYKTNNMQSKYDFFFNYKIPFADIHYIENNLNLLKPFQFVKTDNSTKFIVHEEDDSIGKSLRKKYKHKKIILIQAYSSVSPMKNWPSCYFREFIKKILKQYSAEILLIGSLEEREFVDDIFKGLNLNNICGKFSIGEMASILKYADIFIGNDGGLSKVSIALGTPTITIFGNTDYIHCRNWKAGNLDLYNKVDCAPCIHTIGIKSKTECDQVSKYKCLTSITVEEVFNGFKRLID